MPERAGQGGGGKPPGFVINLVVNRLRHTVLPALDTVCVSAVKIRSDLVICSKSLEEIAEGLKVSDPTAYEAIKVAARSVSDTAYLSRKLKDDLEQFVGNQVRGQATALSRVNVG